MTPGSQFGARSFRSALKHFVLGRAAQAAFTIAFTLVSVRLLSPVEFGAYMVLMGLIDVCRPLVSLGLVPAMQQFVPAMAQSGTREQLQTFLKYTLLIRLLLNGLAAGVCFVFWDQAASWLGFDPVIKSATQFGALLILTVLLADYSANTLESLLQQRLAQPLRTMLPVGKLVGLLSLAAVGHLNITNLLIFEMCTSALVLVGGEWLAHRTVGQIRPDGSRTFSFRDIARFAWHLSGAQLVATFANPGVLRLVVARTLGIESAGQFAFMQQLTQHVTRFLPSLQFANVIRPVLVARFTAGDGQSVAVGGGFLLKMNLLAALPLVVAAGIVWDVLPARLSGGQILSGGLAFTLLLTVPAMVAQENLASTLIQVYRRSELVRLLSLMAPVVPLAAVAGAWTAGLNGACAGAALGFLLQATGTVVAAMRVGAGIAPVSRALIRVLVVALFALILGLIARQFLIGWAAASLALVGYLLAIGLWAKPVSAAEFTLMERSLGRKAKYLRRLVAAD